MSEHDWIANWIAKETDMVRLRRKMDQAWEMADLARQDGDKADAERRATEARLIAARLKELRDASL